MSEVDVDTPTPDDGKEAIRVAVVNGLADLYFLTDLLFDLLGSALDTIDAQAARLDALEAPDLP